ncbi:hypothetical protein, partial [Streptomyces sp. YGL11-2]|uniref:hypothetical protein n=1 Tax=Streptomyces sp. YGL11-2 TaxID=3414028 RepID=UPI003CE8998B
FGLAFPTLSDPRGSDFRRCDPAFRLSHGSDFIRSFFVPAACRSRFEFGSDFPSEGFAFRRGHYFSGFPW